MLMNTLAALCAGFALNIILGAPGGILNPENTVPKFCFGLEKKLKRHYQDTQEAHHMAGFVILFSALIVFFGVPLAILLLLYEPAPLLAFILDCYLCWASFSIIGTREEIEKIYRAMKAGRTDLARISVSKLTGSDCSDMNEDEIIKRTVELAADCGADNAAGVLFYSAIFGGIGGMFFKTVSLIRRTYSTRSEDSIDFGKGAHDLWAFLDFVPAHICALLSNVAASIYGFNTENSFPVFRRDRGNLSSANLAPCRCVYAAALGITLTPRSFIKDGFVSFSTIGNEQRPCAYTDVSDANEIMYASAFFAMLLFAGVKLAVTLILL